MRIKKTYKSFVPSGKIVNSRSTSNDNTYSCDYINNINTYSTEEVKTGETWIDGKPIYRRIITFVTPSTYPSDFILGRIENLGTTITLRGFIGNVTPLPSSWNLQADVGLALEDNNLIKGRLNWSSAVNKQSWILLEYTKTTD